MLGKRSNIKHWQNLQAAGYFDNHPFYQGEKDVGADEAVHAIEQFRPLSPQDKVVVIGCGYGRESVGLCRLASHVWGIDVSNLILQRANDYLKAHNLENFTPVLAEKYARQITGTVDVVFSIVVMQHITRDLVRDYIKTLSAKLNPGGCFVIQFLEMHQDVQRDVNLASKAEPAVSWSAAQIATLAAEFRLKSEIRTIQATDTSVWHWAYMTN